MKNSNPDTHYNGVIEHGKPLIYLASPYTERISDTRELEEAMLMPEDRQSEAELIDQKRRVEYERYRLASAVAAHLIMAGNIVYCPIAHSHSMAIEGRVADGYQPWQELDEFFLERSDILAILTLPGYTESDGVFKEASYFNELQKPIIYIPGKFAEMLLRESDNNRFVATNQED